jgi:hypothetical protein
VLFVANNTIVPIRSLKYQRQISTTTMTKLCSEHQHDHERLLISFCTPFFRVCCVFLRYRTCVLILFSSLVSFCFVCYQCPCCSLWWCNFASRFSSSFVARLSLSFSLSVSFSCLLFAMYACACVSCFCISLLTYTCVCSMQGKITRDQLNSCSSNPCRILQ